MVTSGKTDGLAKIVITDEGPPQAESINRQVSAPEDEFQETEEKSGAALSVLGLIAGQLGGSIEAEDLKPRGNRITITLPLENT
jgi:signal transduction histidine kinase